MYDDRSEGSHENGVFADAGVFDSSRTIEETIGRDKKGPTVLPSKTGVQPSEGSSRRQDCIRHETHREVERDVHRPPLVETNSLGHPGCSFGTGVDPYRMSTDGQRRPGGRTALLARTCTPWGFPVIYLGWAYLFWTPILVSGESVWSFPNAALFLVGGTSPLLAGVLLSWFNYGRSGLRDLGDRLIDIRRIDPRWWLILVLFWPAFNLCMAGVALVFGITSAPLEFVSPDRLFDPVAVVSILVFAFVFPLPEEIGLRGYWLDQLQERFSALTAGLINGTAWAIWHAPFVLLPGYYAQTTFQPELSWWLPMLVFVALFHVWVYNNTDRSILAVLVFHAFVNLTGEVMGFAPEMYPFVLSGYVFVTTVLVFGWSPESLCGWNRARPTVTRPGGTSR